MQPFNSTFDNDPRLYDSLRSCWLNQRREEFIAAQLERYRLPDGALVLEIGSGTGWLLNRLGTQFPRLRFMGLEPISGYVDFAAAKAPANVFYSKTTLENVEELPERPRVLLSNDVLHHVPSYEGAVRAAARLASAECRWLAIEPNYRNLYTFVKQATGYGEQNFWPGRFGRTAAAEGWTLQLRGHLFLIPPSVKQPPAWMKTVEKRLDGVPFLAGGVFLELRQNSEGVQHGARRNQSAR